MNQKGFAPIILLLGILILIIIGGGIYYLNQKATKVSPQQAINSSVILTPTPSPSRQNSPTPQATSNHPISNANWLTYKNSTYSYEIKYPTDWSVIEAKPKPTSGTPNNGQDYLDKDEFQKTTFEHNFNNGIPGIEQDIKISVKSNSDGLSLSQIANNSFSKDNQTDLNFAGYPALKLIYPAGSYPPIAYVIILNKGYLYTISFFEISPDDTETNYALARSLTTQILSTFKFDK